MLVSFFSKEPSLGMGSVKVRATRSGLGVNLIFAGSTFLSTVEVKDDMLAFEMAEVISFDLEDKLWPDNDNPDVCKIWGSWVTELPAL
jgi:hypothetical protein